MSAGESGSTGALAQIEANSSNFSINDEKPRKESWIQIFTPVAVLAVLAGHFIWATFYFITETDDFVRNSLCDGYGFWLILFSFIIYGYVHIYFLKIYLLKPLNNVLSKPLRVIHSCLFDGWRKWVTYVVIYAALLAFLLIDAWGNLSRLVPAAGLIIFLLFAFMCSRNRSKINWDTILRGIILQFVFGLITLRWKTGKEIFECAGNKATTFLGFAQDGAAFVYGDKLIVEYTVFAFGALSSIYFLSFVINVLYHLGIIQVVVGNLGNLLHNIMGTSICESFNSAANIFLGQTEAPLLFKFYLENMTASEIHAIMVGGFASVSGTVMAAYINFGAKASHLITASVMAAPGGLVFSKLFYPEEETVQITKETVELSKSEFSSLLDAASQGASQGTPIVLGIIANLISFIACIFFINGVLAWFGGLVGFTEPDEIWSVDLIVGYIFTPVSFLMGVPWKESRDVGKLIGIKSMINEFAAFAKFSEMDYLKDRTKIIATFAICGFANPGSVGMVISALSALVPNKSNVIIANVFRAAVAGTLVCFSTACIAGMLALE